MFSTTHGHSLAPTASPFPWAVALAVVVAAVGWYWQYAAYTRTELSIVAALIERWQGVSGSWSRALLIARGPSSYYAPTSPQDIQAYIALLKDVAASPDPYSFDLVHKTRVWEQDAHKVLDFFSSVCLLILTGRLASIVRPDPLLRDRASA